MKAKINREFGTATEKGDIVEALLNPNNNSHITFYGRHGVLLDAFDHDWSPVEEKYVPEKPFVTLKELLGFDVKTIEFK